MTGDRLTEIPVIFYRPVGGGEPIREWLRSLPAVDRHVIGIDLSAVQFGWPVGMPLCRACSAIICWHVRTQPYPQPPDRAVAVSVHEVFVRMRVVHAIHKRPLRRPRRTILR